MIIFAKEDGRVESSPAFIPKGSGGVPVQVFAPYFAGCTCEVWVLPPTALQLDPAILSPEFGGAPGVWAGKLPPGTAESPGRGDYQLRFTDAEGTEVATLAGSYAVQRGVVDAYPENMSDLSNYSLKAFATLLAQFANQFNDVLTSDNLQEELKGVEYTMKLSKNVLSWGISGKILASVILTGLIGSTGCVFSEKENRESLATIIESVPIIAESESEAAEINTTRAELVTALRETTEEPDEPIVEAYIVTVSLTGAYATINGQTFYTSTALGVDSGESVTIIFGATMGGYSVKPSDGAVIECNSAYTGAEDGDNYAITITPTADTQVSCAAAKVESLAVLSRLEVVASGFPNSVNGYSLYVGEGSPYKKYGDLRNKLTVYAVYTKDGVESSRSTVSSYVIKNEAEAISAKSGGYAALELSYNGVSNAVLFDLVSADKITSSTLYINSNAVANGATVSLDKGTSFADMIKSHALRMDLVYSVNGVVNTADVPENLFTVEGYDDLGNAWIDATEVVGGTNKYKIRYGNSAIGYATYEVTIAAPPEIFVTGITLSQTSATLKVGESLQLTVDVQPANAEHKEIMWYSNSDAVTVENGLVTAIALPGGKNTAIITAQSISSPSVTAACTFEIQPVLVESITITPSALSLKVGETAEVSYSFTPANATNPSFEVIVPSEPSEIEVVSHDTTNRKIVIKAISMAEVALVITTSDYSVYSTCPVTVEATDTAEDTIAYAWATVNAYSSWKRLPQLDDQYLQLKKAEASSAEDYSAAENSDINLSDESKAVTITIDGTLYDENGAVSAADSGGLLKAQLSRANGIWACDWAEFQQGGTRYTSFSASDPANIEISGSAIRIYLGKRIVGANEYQMYFTTTKANHHIDYKITVAVS